MSAMSGSEIARQVLGYLQSQQMDQIALDFARESPYLREEYRSLKRGIKIKTLDKPRSLLKILKEFIAIEETVTELFEDELKQHDRIPYELLEIKTLEDKVKYICQNFKSVNKNVPCQSQSQSQIQSTSSSVSRKRSNISNTNENSSDSDLTEQSSPRTTSEQDSSHSSRPPSKRRRLIDDPDLMFTGRCENMSSHRMKKTPLKLILTSQPKDSTSSQYVQSSPKKLLYGMDMAESFMMDSTMPELIAQGINESVGKSNIPINHVTIKAGDIAGDIAGNITQDILDTLVYNCVETQNFDMFSTLPSPSGSRAYSEGDCEIVSTEENRELNTPIPNESSSNSRYDLRSNRKSSSNVSAESERKSGKPQILSNERVDILPKTALAQSRSEPIELSDSDTEAVTTTSQPPQQQQQRQQYYIQLPQSQQSQFFDPTSGPIYIVRYGDTQSQSQPIPLAQYQAATSTVECPLDTNTNLATTSNVIDESQFTVNEGSQILSFLLPNQNCTTISDSERKRLIVINGDDVNKEGSQTLQTILIDQQSTSADSLKTATKKSQEASTEQTKTNQIEKDKTVEVAQLKQISSQKVVTPKQLIKSNVPSSSRSLSTPRNKNPHVRVLDFNCTPNRFRLSEIDENKNESISNTSRFFNETPHNRSIASSMPSSAPPKVDSTRLSRRISIEKSIESSSAAAAADAFVPIDENTVISGDGETPKVRKSNRRSCVRSISSHKENHPNDERSKRVATTKKKICPDDGDSNGSEQGNKKADTIIVSIPISNEDAMAEWQRARNASKNPELFEQQLREQNSKKQANEHSTVRKKRPTRSKKKPAATRKKQTNKMLPDDATKPENMSLNSTLDNNDSLNSTQLNLEARLLEENLKSAKKATPAKQAAHKTAKKKTPNRKLQIKLMPSPKNKSLKRLRSAKNLAPSNERDKNSAVNVESISSDKLNEVVVEAAESSSIVNTEVESGLNNQISIEASEKTIDLPNSKAIEASETLLKLEEIIKQQEIERKKSQIKENQSESISTLQPPAEPLNVAEPMKVTTNEPMPNDKFTSVLLGINQPNLSMSSLLETPFKDCGAMFPRTPNLGNMLSQLNTPMVRHPCPSLMDDSIFKNPQWPTPSFPITPGAMFSSLTPLKDVLSPRSEDIVYGAPNRPTDYSSSSSYYKPDESDGIDRQIQANIQSARKNSDVYSADDMDESSKIDNTTQNTSRTSSSSSSSSSDSSDSDSDSDSSSSSDSDTSQRAEDNFVQDQNDQEHDQQHEEQQQSIPVDNLIDEDTTQEIKSQMVCQVNIAQNILLSEPEAPILKKDEEQSKLLSEKLRRMQESLRKDEMKNHEKLKPKQIKKYHRTINDAKRDRLRGIQAISSPSKRKSTQPKKIVSIHSQQIYSEVMTLASSQTKQVIETNVQSTIIAERLKTEAAGDNAIADASLKPQAAQKNAIEDEESLEAIQLHINSVVSEEPHPKKNLAASAQRSKESISSMIDMLSEKQKKFDANRPKTKTEVIEALPLTKATRPRTRSQRATIAPAKNIITQPAAKPTDSSKVQRRSKENKPNANSTPTVPNQTEKIVAKPIEPPKVEVMNDKPECNFETPAKQRLSRQKIRDLFGDCTDIETPIKSPPKTLMAPPQVKESSKVEEKSAHDTTTNESLESENGNDSTKFEADSSNVNDESDETDDDEEEYEMTLSIDENDKKRFIFMRENASAISKTSTQPVVIGTKRVRTEGVEIFLEPSDVMELYTQDVNSVAEMKKYKERPRSAQETKTEVNAEAIQSDSDSKYGKPLHTSTPSPAKAVTPKFNIKHKSTTMVSPKSAKKQNDFNSIKIDDILHHLHPTAE